MRFLKIFFITKLPVEAFHGVFNIFFKIFKKKYQREDT